MKAEFNPSLNGPLADQSQPVEAAPVDKLISLSPVILYRGQADLARGTLHINWSSANLCILAGAGNPADNDGGWWLDRVHPDDRDRVTVSFQRLQQRDEMHCEYRFRCQQGGYRWLSDQRHVLHRDAETVSLQGFLLDVTDRRQVQERLHEREQLLRQLIETETDCVAVVQADGMISEINPAGVSLLDCRDSGELVGTHMAAYLSRDQRARVAVLSRQVLSGEASTASLKLVTAKGRVRSVEVRMAPLFGPHGRIESAVIVARDVSRRDEVEHQAHFLAHYDMLTGLPNRGLFRDRLLQAMANCKRNNNLISVMFLDIDHFKDVNDTLGHAVGDRLLKEIAARIGACVRESDTVARFGGDEFGVIQTNLKTVNDAVELAERIVEQISQPMLIDGHEIHSGVSIGVTLYPFEEQDANGLLKNADMAMYKAKREGRNRFQFYVAELNQMVQQRAVIERDLRTALQRDEFQLHYQPQLDLRTGQVVGVEALLRWHQPERGNIPPGDFIPVAESTGLILGIGDWVLKEACRQAQAWLDEGLPPIRVAVNLSPVQFRHKNLIGSITEALEASGLDPCLLEIELTESLIMRDVEATIETLEHLSSLGIQISVDDFGTGYSSLSYLTRFPIQKIKLDQSFVRDIDKKDGAAICRTIIALGQSLDMRVMAEGVEQPDQLGFLREYGCHEVQGYYFSRPMPAGALRRLIQQASDELRVRAVEE